MAGEFDLDIVGIIEGTDKSSAVSFGWDYLRHYQRLFQRFWHKPINVIEIGVLGGASLKVWEAYFTRATIIGVDIKPECERFAGGRVRIEIGSQDDPGFLAQLCAKFPPTIVIDDGSHRDDHVIFTFERVFPSLLPGGLYVVEDLCFHFGEESKVRGFSDQTAPDYFLRLARSAMAGSVQDARDGGMARFTFEHLDAIEFIHSAAVITKKGPARDLAEALGFADSYLRSASNVGAAHGRLARFVLKNGGPIERAEANVQRAIELDGDKAEVLHTYAEIRHQQGRLPEAAALAERAASLAGSVDYWAYAGELSTNTGDHAGAVRAFRQAQALKQGDTLLAHKLSDALERQGKLEEALSAAEITLKSAAGKQGEKRLRARADALRARLAK